MNIKLNLEPFNLPGIEKKRPLIIAGPCSAESEEQILKTAKQLAEQGIKIFRAGIWKPRTRPNAFEGVGSIGLTWLKKVKEQFGMYTATEVANVKHIYEALKFGVDILWIGARTVANPFAVQEIADTLKGTDIPILVKNPVNPDIELWIGALERLNNAGLTKLAAIHRGFSIYHKTQYRNDPQWQIPIELHRRIPELPIIVDPSHICGNRELLFEISQNAMDLDFYGLIIESHYSPEKALSDAKQQLTPENLKKLLSGLVLRHSDVDKRQAAKLTELRTKIDKFDDDILHVFEQRMQISEEIGKFKKENDITILQTERWDNIIKKRTDMGLKKGLSSEFVTAIFTAIHQESINHQNKIMNEE